MKFSKLFLAPTFLCLCLLIVGCRGPLPRLSLSPRAGSSEKATMLADKDEESDDETTDESVKLVSATTDKPMTFTDSGRLQYGCGEMDPDAPTAFQMTSSGLRYRVLRKGSGRMPTASNSVTVNYRGWLDSGKEFDSSYDRGEPISFPLTGVIKGWTEGMQLVGESGMIELWVPAGLGYGREGSGGSVPPNATLHFIVELISVK
jgi:FKBP-type peptidyl-prolyl cis-trans isomerase FkpA